MAAAICSMTGDGADGVKATAEDQRRTLNTAEVGKEVQCALFSMNETKRNIRVAHCPRKGVWCRLGVEGHTELRIPAESGRVGTGPKCCGGFCRGSSAESFEHCRHLWHIDASRSR